MFRPRHSSPLLAARPSAALVLGVSRSLLRQVCAGAIAAALALGGPARAAIITWDGSSTDGLWATGANWSNGSGPAATDTINFDSDLSVSPWSIALGTNRTVAGVTFSSGTAAQGFTLTGNILTVGATGITNSDNDLQTFASTVTLSAAQSWSATSGGLSFAAVNLSNTTTARILTVTGSFDTTISGSIANGVASSGNVTKTGTGALTLSGANTYTGATTLSAGTLNLNNASALGGNGTLSLADGTTLDNKSGNAITLSSVNSQTWGNFTFTGTNDLNMGSGGVSLGGTSRVITVSAGNLTTSGVIIDGGGTRGLTKAGAGTLILDGTSSTYTGPTVITAGTLAVKSLANGAAASSIGDSTAAAGNLVLDGGTLKYTGAGSTSNRLFTIGRTTAGGTATIDASGTGALVLNGTGSLLYGTNNQNRNLILTGSNTANNQLSAILANNGSGVTTLTKEGVGTWLVAGTNTYTGGTTINAGTLSLGSAGAIGSTGTIAFGGGTLQFGANNTTDYSSRFSTAASQAYNIDTNGQAVTFASNLTSSGGILTKSGSGALTLTGTNTYSGGTNIDAGTIALGSAGAIGTTGTIAFDGGTLQFGANNTTDYSSRFSTADSQAYSINTNGQSVTFATGLTSSGGTLAKSGTGTLILTGTNTFSGTTTISGGTLQIGNGGTSGSLSSSSAITANSALVFNRSDNISVSNTIDGSGTLTQAGAGALTLSGANSYTGGTNINAGTLSLGSAGAIGTTGTIAFGGGTLQFGASNTTDYSSRFSTAASQAYKIDTNGQAVTFASNLTSPGGILTKSGSGALTLTGANTYTGGTNINAGTIALGSAGAIGTTGTIAFGGGTLQFGASNTTDYSSRFSTAASQAYNIDTNGQAVTLASNLTSSGGTLTKTGTGTLSLSGTNTYTGGTTLSNGTLNINSASAIGSGTFAIGAGTTIDSTFAGGVTLSTNNAQTWGGDFAFTGTNNLTLGTGAVTLLGNSIVTVNGSTLAVGGAITDGASTFSLTKAGSGALTLSGANTYDGGTVLNAGALNINSSSAIGSGSMTINAGSINNTSGGAIVITANNGQTWNGDFAFGGTNNLDIGTGTITLGGSRILTTNGSATLTVGGTMTDGASTFSFTKAGTGALTLGGANTFDGGLTLSAGTLNINNATAVGTGALTLNGGTLDSTSGSITLSNNNAQTWGGNFAFTGTQNLNLGTGAVTLNGNRTVTANGGVLTVGGAIGGSTYGLTKAGAGELVFGGTNTYDGGTTLSAGTLTVNSGAALAASTGGLTVNGGTLNFNNSAQTVSSLNGSGGNIAFGSGHLLTVNTTTTDSFAGTFSGTGNLTKTGSGSLSLSGNSSSYSGVTTLSGGVLNAQSNNALGTGNVTVANNTTLQLQGSGIAVGSGSATVTLSGSGTGVGGNTAALINVGGGSTRLKNNVDLAGDTTISSGTTGSAVLKVGGAPPVYTPGVSAPDTNTLALNAYKLTLAGAATTTVQIDARITGTGGVDVNTAGTVNFNANQNTYTGTTTVLNGTLIVNTVNNPYAPHDPSSTSFYGINGPLVIGDGSGAANSAAVQIGVTAASHNEVIKSTAPITIYSDGYLNLNGGGQTIGKLTMNGGNIAASTGGIYFDFANTSVDVNLTNNSTVSTISGRVSLTFHKDAPTEGGIADYTRTFNVGSTTDGVSDLTITGMIGNGGMIKTGAGLMSLTTSNNDYLGSTTINNGVLNIQQGTEFVSGSYRSSLGAGDSDGSLGANTIVNSGGTLQMQGGIAITNEALTLNGTGFTGRGALQSLSGNNTWGSASTGLITLGSNSTITTTADTLTIPTVISSTGGNFALTFNGAGNTVVSGSINTGTSAATVTKAGTGTLTLSGDNGYQGATNITAGVVSVQHNNGLGAVSTGSNGTFVTSGAELQLNNTAHGNLTIGGEALTLNGFGYGVGATAITGPGALHNVSGNNSFGGQISLGSATAIKSDANTLTLSGGMVNSVPATHNALTVGGVGNTTFTGAVTTGNVTLNGSNVITSVGSGSTLDKIDSGRLTFGGGVTSTLDGITLTAGNITVTGTNTKVLSGAVGTGLATPAGTTSLTIDSGATVQAYYAAATSTTFNGSLAGAGTFEKDGAGILVFNNTFTATNLSLVLNGGTLSLTGAQITVGTIHITGNTILDFNNSANTFLSSASLVIDAGVTVTVNNWISVANDVAGSTAWFVRNGSPSTVNAGTLGGTDIVGGTPLNQIVFTNYGGLTTTWVSGNHNGWFANEIRPTPEPATYGAIFMSGCLGLLGWRRFRRRETSKSDV